MILIVKVLLFNFCSVDIGVLQLIALPQHHYVSPLTRLQRTDFPI